MAGEKKISEMVEFKPFHDVFHSMLTDIACAASVEEYKKVQCGIEELIDRRVAIPTGLSSVIRLAEGVLKSSTVMLLKHQFISREIKEGRMGFTEERIKPEVFASDFIPFDKVIVDLMEEIRAGENVKVLPAIERFIGWWVAIPEQGIVEILKHEDILSPQSALILKWQLSAQQLDQLPLGSEKAEEIARLMRRHLAEEQKKLDREEREKEDQESDLVAGPGGAGGGDVGQQ